MQRFTGSLFFKMMEFAGVEILPTLSELSRNWRDRVRDYKLYQHYQLDWGLYTGTCFHEMFESTAQRFPMRIAITMFSAYPHGKKVEITYKDLNERANKVARHLIRTALSPESVLGIHLPISIEYVICMLGILKAGHAFIPLSTNSEKLPRERLNLVCRRTGTRYIFTNNEFSLTHLTDDSLQQINVQTLLEDPGTDPSNNLNLPIAHNHLAYIITSSGTTGEPKSIEIEHAGIAHRIYAHHQMLSITDKDNVSQFADSSFDASIMEITMTLTIGARLVVIPQHIKLSVNELGQFYNDQQITIGIFTPSMLTLLEPGKFPLVREIISTGEKLGYELYKKWKFKLIDGYGPSEFTICTSMGVNKDKKDGDFKTHVGRAIYGTRALILDEKFDEVKDGKEGDLYLAGAGLARGYRGDSTLTMRHFLKLPSNVATKLKIPDGRVYQTNDIAEWTEDKNIVIKGRKNRQDKVHGQLVSLQEIETALESHGEISRAVSIFKRKDENSPLYIVVFIKLAKLSDEKKDHLSTPTNNQDNLEEFYQYLLTKLPKYMIPARWVVVDEIPTTLNHQKIDYAALQKYPTEKLVRIKSKALSPRTDMERRVMQVFVNVLDIKDETISILDDFFYIGGDSISLAKLKSALETNLPFKLEMRCLAYEPTVAGISRYIETALAVHDKKHESLVKLAHKEFGPPLFCVHPMTGDAEVYRKFVAKVPNNARAIYGIQARGLSNPVMMEESLMQMASDYIRQMKLVQPLGPYYLLGYSSGAAVAYAMTILLTNEYQDKVKLYLVDAPHPSVFQCMDSIAYSHVVVETLSMSCKINGIDEKWVPKPSQLHFKSKPKQLAVAFDLLIETRGVTPAQAHQLRLQKAIKLSEFALGTSEHKTPNKDLTEVTLFSATKTAQALSTDIGLGWGNVVRVCEPYEATHFDILEAIAIGSPTIQQVLTTESMLTPVTKEGMFRHKETNVWKLPKKPKEPYYIERKDTVHTLTEYVLGCDEKQKPSLQLLSGFQGSGKSTTAIQCVWQLYSEKSATYIVWIDNNDDNIQSEFFRFVKLLGIQTNFDSQLATVVTQVHDKLKALNIDSIVFVFDSVKSKEQIEPFVTLLFNHKNKYRVHIMLTSIDGTIDFEVDEKTSPIPKLRNHPLEEFTQEEAADFVSRRLSKPEDIPQLIETIGKLPLALDLACTYMETHEDWTVSQFISEYANEHDYRKKLKVFDVDEKSMGDSVTLSLPLAHTLLPLPLIRESSPLTLTRMPSAMMLGRTPSSPREAKVQAHRKSLRKIMVIHLEKVKLDERDNTKLQGLMFIVKCIAHFAVNEIPDSLMRDLSNNQEHAKECIAYLQRLSLVTARRTESETFYSIHRSIQEILLLYYTDDELSILTELLRFFHVLLEYETIDIARKTDTWPKILTILVHVRAVAERSCRHKELQVDAIRLLVKVALYYLCAANEYYECGNLLERALSLYEDNLVEEPKLKFKILLHLGVSYINISDYESSLRTLGKAEKLANKMTNLLDGSQLSHLHNSLCCVYIYLNNFDKAIAQGERSLQFTHSSGGRIAYCHEILGLAYLGSHRIADAKSQTQEAYGMFSRDKDDKGMVRAPSRTGEARLCQGIVACYESDYKTADGHFEGSLGFYRRAYNEDIFETAEALVWHGWAKFGLKDYESAIKFSNQALSIYKDNTTHNHRIIFGYVLLALCYDCTEQQHSQSPQKAMQQESRDSTHERKAPLHNKKGSAVSLSTLHLLTNVGETSAGNKALFYLSQAVKFMTPSKKLQPSLIIGFIPLFDWDKYAGHHDIHYREKFLGLIVQLYTHDSLECALFNTVLAEAHAKKEEHKLAHDRFAHALKICSELAEDPGRAIPQATKTYLENRIRETLAKLKTPGEAVAVLRT